MRCLKFLLLLIILLTTMSPIYAYDSYVIKQMTVEWNFEQNGLLHITETYDVEYDDVYRSAFILELPLHKSIELNNNERLIFDCAITNVKVNSQNATKISETKDGYQIEFMNLSNSKREIYEISYLVKLDPVIYNQMEYIAFDMGDSRTEGTIEKINFDIHLPVIIDENKIQIRSNYHELKEYSYESNVIKGMMERISIHENVEVVIQSKDYFKVINYDVVNYISIAIVYVLSFVMVFILRHRGKEEELEVVDDYKVIKEFSALEVGYLHKGYSHPKDVVALFLQWAQKGYIDLEYVEQQKTVIFHKKRDLPISTKEYEKDIFNELFALGNKVRLKMIRGVFGKVIKNSQKKMSKIFKSKETKVYSSTFEKMVLCFICSLPLSLVIGMQMYIRTLSLLHVFAIVSIYGIVVALLTIFMKYITKNKMNHIILHICLLVIGIGIFCISYYTYGEYIPMGILFISTIISIIMIQTVCVLKTRSVYGNQILSKVKGLYAYINKEDKTEFEKDIKLIEELFPYAYAMNLEYALLPYMDDMDWMKNDHLMVAIQYIYDHMYSTSIEKNYIH